MRIEGFGGIAAQRLANRWDPSIRLTHLLVLLLPAGGWARRSPRWRWYGEHVVHVERAEAVAAAAETVDGAESAIESGVQAT